ncbi:MAG: hypothetical protein ABJB33_01170 [Gemmatimonadota bacterium]
MKRATFFLALVGLSCGPLAAQVHHRRTGVEVGLGFGAGNLSVGCPECDNGRSTGLARVSIATWNFSPRLGVGTQVVGVEGGRNGYTERESSTILFVQAVPTAKLPLILSAGVGSGKYVARFVRSAASTERYAATGRVLQFGLGMEVPFAPEITLVPQLTWRSHQAGQLASDSGPLVDGLKAEVIQFDITLRWRFFPAEQRAVP